jgi:hypothetical protein
MTALERCDTITDRRLEASWRLPSYGTAACGGGRTMRTFIHLTCKYELALGHRDSLSWAKLTVGMIARDGTRKGFNLKTMD